MTPLRQKALTLLATREHSAVELKQKLKTMADAAELETLISDLAAAGLQSDKRFAESLIRVRIRTGYGPRRIEQELQQKGIDRALIAELLPEDHDYWSEQLQTAWQKKYHHCTPDNRNELARQMRFLLQRGFPHELVMRFLTNSFKI